MNTCTKGMVSVVMPFLDPPVEFFREAVGSVRQQTYSNWELLLMDDGSRPEATAVATELQYLEPERIRYIEHDGHRNLGISASRNHAISKAAGEFVAFLDADDVWDEGQLEAQVALLNENSSAAMLYGNTVYWHSWRTGFEDVQHSLGIDVPRMIKPPGLVRMILRRRTISPCMTSIVVRRTVFDDGIRFEPEFREHYEDQVFIAKVAIDYPVYVSDQCWGKYRQHPGSVTAGDDHSDVAHAWRKRYLAWLIAYLEEHDLRLSLTWLWARLEARTMESERARRMARWLRTWQRRVEKLLGALRPA